MEIEILRYNSEKDYTDGLLFINCKFQVHTLEDEYRSEKVYGETRIPNGKYEVKLRTVGGFHEKYLRKFGADFHKGMLWVKDVPNFEHILIHIGNTDEDTAGCLLVGMSNDANKTGFVGNSTQAYTKIYSQVRDAILNGEKVYINYKSH